MRMQSRRTHLALQLSAVVLVMVGVAVFLLSRTSTHPVLETHSARTGGPAVDPAASESMASDQPETAPDTALSAELERIPFPAPTSESEVGLSLILRGECTDAAGDPLPGVRVARLDTCARNQPLPDAPASSVVSDSAGRFLLKDPPASEELCLGFWADGFVPVSTAIGDVPATGERDLGTFALPRGVRLLGVVTDEQGAPLPGVPVLAGRRDRGGIGSGMRSGQPDGSTTNAFGELDLGLCLPGAYTLRTPDHVLIRGGTEVVVPTASEHRFALVVAPAIGEFVLAGRVRSLRGEPVAEAKVYATNGKSGHWRSTTDAGGAFRLVRGEAKDEPARLSALADGYDLTVVPEPLAWGDTEVEVVLRDAPRFALRVVDPDHADVRSFSVRVYRLGAHPLAPFRTQPYDYESRPDVGGLTWITDLISGAHRLRVQPSGRDDLMRSPFVPLVVGAEGTAKELTVVLPARVKRPLRILTLQGLPVPDCNVELQEVQPEKNGDVGVFDGVAFGSVLIVPSEELILAQGRTNAQGEVVMEGPSRTPVVVNVRGPGCMPKSVQLPFLDGDGVLEISVEASSTVVISVDSPEILEDLARALPNPPTLRFVAAGMDVRSGGERLVLDPRSFARGAGGAHGRTIPLSPGRWTPILDLHWEQFEQDPFFLSQGEVSTITIDVTRFAPATLEGSLTMSSTALSMADFELQHLVEVLGPQGAYWGPRLMRTDSAGRFRLECLPGSYRVVVPQGAGQMKVLALPGKIELAPSELRRQEFNIQLGELRVRFVDAQRQPVKGVREVELLRATDLGWFAGLGLSDEDGWIRLPCCEAGSFHLRTLPMRLSEHRAQVDLVKRTNDLGALDRERIALGAVTVPANSFVEVEIVLPPAYFD